MPLKKTLKPFGILMLLLLTLQYLLGMIANLYIEFPEEKNRGKLWEFAWKQLPLAVHISIGYLLLLGAIVLIILSIRQKNKSWIIASSVGAIAILIAGATGAIFITAQKEIYSYIMAVSFIAAFVAYGWGLYATK